MNKLEIVLTIMGLSIGSMVLLGIPMLRAMSNHSWDEKLTRIMNNLNELKKSDVELTHDEITFLESHQDFEAVHRMSEEEYKQSIFILRKYGYTNY